MVTIERAPNAHSLFWIKDDCGDRLGVIWGLDEAWRWSVEHADSKPATSYEDARFAVERALGQPVIEIQRDARIA